MQNPQSLQIPSVTVTHTWQGWVVQDPYMGRQVALSIHAELEDAVEAAESWARDVELPVRIVR